MSGSAALALPPVQRPIDVARAISGVQVRPTATVTEGFPSAPAPLPEPAPFDTVVMDAADLRWATVGTPAAHAETAAQAHANDAGEGRENIRESYIRVRPEPGVEVVQRFLGEIGSAQLALTMHLYELDRAMSGIASTKATRTAAKILAARVGEIDTLRDALNDLYMASAAPEVADALAHDGVFTEYLRGVYACAESTVRALSILCTELRALSPDWFRLRARLTDARDFYLVELEDGVEDAIRALRLGANGELPATLELEERIGSVILASTRLMTGLSNRFG